MEIINYTEKSIVVKGDTKSHKDALKSLGGKCNSKFTHKETGEKFGGWVFPKTKQNIVKKWLNDSTKPVISKIEETNILNELTKLCDISANEIKIDKQIHMPIIHKPIEPLFKVVIIDNILPSPK